VSASSWRVSKIIIILTIKQQLQQCCNFSGSYYHAYHYKNAGQCQSTSVCIFTTKPCSVHSLTPFTHNWRCRWRSRPATRQMAEGRVHLISSSAVMQQCATANDWNGDGVEGDPRLISRWTTNWRVNSHKPSLYWWHHPVGHFEGRP